MDNFFLDEAHKLSKFKPFLSLSKVWMNQKFHILIQLNYNYLNILEIFLLLSWDKLTEVLIKFSLNIGFWAIISNKNIGMTKEKMGKNF
jgi:hypothetical protein